MELKPMDICVFSSGYGQPWYKWLVHKIINWRSLDSAVHCAVMIDETMCLSPEFKGIVKRNITDYKGCYVSIYRYKHVIDSTRLVEWCNKIVGSSTGYDFWRQWLLGYVLGIIVKNISNDDSKWTCSELPYWAFEDNGYKLTSKQEVLPMPRLFRYHKDFECVYDGVLESNV